MRTRHGAQADRSAFNERFFMARPPRSRSVAASDVAGPKLKLDLALQGGGSHGAFTWGVLDRLLEEEWLEIAAVSGTSAGAMNAVALAAGLMDGGREGARKALRRFWERVAELSPFHAFENGPLGGLAAATSSWMEPWMAPWKQMAQTAGSQFSPYQSNPLNHNPLRQILLDTVDFERVRGCNKTLLFIAATQVRTGTLKIFDPHSLTPDMVLASACLPMLFQAIEIDGEAYWDGGYAGNPSLMPLIMQSAAKDLMLVQINPNERSAIPMSAADIQERVSEITFNTSLQKELRSIALLKRLIEDEGKPSSQYKNQLFHRVGELRVHLIDGGTLLGPLGPATKGDTQLSFLQQMCELGRSAAAQWLEQNSHDLGKRSSWDLNQVLES